VALRYLLYHTRTPSRARRAPRVPVPKVAKNAKDLSTSDHIGLAVPPERSRHEAASRASVSVSTTTTQELAEMETIAACHIVAQSSLTMAVEALVNVELSILCT